MVFIADAWGLMFENQIRVSFPLRHVRVNPGPSHFTSPFGPEVIFYTGPVGCI